MMAVYYRFQQNMRGILQVAAFLMPLLCSLAFLACTEDAPNAPGVSHEFTWEVDTIMQQSWQYRGQTLWGSSANNVYLGAFNNDGHEALVHWDGRKWTPIDLFQFGLGGNITMIDGLDSSFFIAIGDGGRWGRAARYADGRWDTLRLPRTRPYFTCVDVVSRNEIYIGCVDGILKHDGTNWEWLLDSTDSEIPGGGPLAFFPTSILKTNNGELIFNSQNNSQTDGKLFFWKFITDRFVAVDSFRYSNSNAVWTFGTRIYRIGSKVYSSGKGVFEYNGGEWHKITDIGGYLFSGSDQMLFSGGLYDLYHYNGVDWKDIFPKELKKSGFSLGSLLYVGNTLFAQVENGSKTLVLRGKQK